MYPKQFGAYMATGSKKGSAEQIVFLEIEGGFGDDFDWDYAKASCVPHPNGDPKHSVYLSVYRAFENIPLDKLGNMYLTTRDGRTLEIKKETYEAPKNSDYYVYHEICPITPLIVSKLDPESFGKNITNSNNKVSLPKIMFADCIIPNLDDMEKTGNTGGIFINKKAHFLSCVSSISSENGKENKTFDRSNVESFTFQIINKGFYISDGTNTLLYKMPTVEEIKQIDYDWGRSALII